MLAPPDFSWLDRPRLRENLWQVSPDEPLAFVDTPDGSFTVPTGQALAFLAIRAHCTPHNSVAEIAARSGVPVAEVAAMLASLQDIGLIGARGDGDVTARLQRMIALWSHELARDFIGNALIAEELPRSVLVGWLLETYHYVRDFPEAIAQAAEQAADGPLRLLLHRYAEEERGHEHFVLETLENIGLSRAEVIASRPLVSTRMIGFLMRDLFALAPAAVLLMAGLVEAQELPEEQVAAFQVEMEVRYDLSSGALAPYFAHQAIDAQLGHQRLFADHAGLFDLRDPALLDRVIDRLHDLKHGFDLQGLEIRHYYGAQQGAYLPRQPMELAAI